ncbi:hypothetical protein [Methanobrevibacter sp.]|uniref:hypothetical protein n=1 Tax=Methanobrevibacter sp. TaxID=66852 RepID=UPI00386F275C
MKGIVKYIIETDYDNLVESLKEVEYGVKVGLIVNYNDTKYEFLLNIKENSEECICLSSSVITPERRERFHLRPVFHRLSWEFDQSAIFYNDPTRYAGSTDEIVNDPRGGWGVGKFDDYFLRNIKDMVIKIVDYYGIAHKNILFYGSSMGGFKSLMLGTMVRDSMVLADLPQLNLLNYRTFVENVIDTIYKDYSKEELETINYRFSVIDMMKKENYVPDAFINISCRPYDIKSQYSWFINQLNELVDIEDNDNNIQLQVRPIPGHYPMSNELSMEYINRRFAQRKLQTEK